MLSTSHIRTYLWGYSQRGQMCRTVTAWGRPSRNAISTIQYSAHWSGIKVEGGRSQHIHTDSCMQHIFFWNELTYCWSHQSPVSSAIFVDSASPSLEASVLYSVGLSLYTIWPQPVIHGESSKFLGPVDTSHFISPAFRQLFLVYPTFHCVKQSGKTLW